MGKNKSVEEYIERKREWKDALEILRSVMLSTEMKETIKWGSPVYTIDDKNVVGLAAFKSYVGIWFYQGVFLSDKAKKLINAQEGKTKGLRQWRFSNIDEIHRDVVLEYVKEAIQNQKENKEIIPEKSKVIVMPLELSALLASDKDLEKRFKELTAFKRKEYVEYIATAKRETTRSTRLKKISPMILEGIGLNDKYR